MVGFRLGDFVSVGCIEIVSQCDLFELIEEADNSKESLEAAAVTNYRILENVPGKLT